MIQVQCRELGIIVPNKVGDFFWLAFQSLNSFKMLEETKARTDALVANEVGLLEKASVWEDHGRGPADDNSRVEQRLVVLNAEMKCCEIKEWQDMDACTDKK